jgi:ribosomal protein S18 acetylase RimI-like enzyme
MAIRRAKPEDADAIAAVHVAAWRAAYAGLMPASYLNDLSVEKRSSFWHRSLTEPNPGTLIVAQRQNAIAGFCFFGPSRDTDGSARETGEILSLNVHPQYWRKGIARGLCEFVLSEAPRRGWSAITLWVLKGNEPACRFYQTLGFLLDGIDRTETTLIGAPLNEVRYRKTVVPRAV